VVAVDQIMQGGMMASIAIHAWIAGSRANGPGTRTVVWVQGCTLACRGCFNPNTHTTGSHHRPVRDLLAEMIAVDPTADGLTISGGEPLQQPEPLSEIITGWKNATGSSVIVLTGYTWTEVVADDIKHSAVGDADVVIAGRYNSDLHIGEGMRGSKNKEYVFLTTAYCETDFAELPEVEVIVTPEGGLVQTGMAAMLNEEL